jgi:hypothetical protein
VVDCWPWAVAPLLVAVASRFMRDSLRSSIVRTRPWSPGWWHRWCVVRLGCSHIASRAGHGARCRPVGGADWSAGLVRSAAVLRLGLQSSMAMAKWRQPG